MRSKYKVVSPEVSAMLDALKTEGAANRAALDALRAEGAVNRAALEALTVESKANRGELKREDHSKSVREWISIGTQVGTLIVLAATLVAVLLQVREMVRAYGPLQQQSDAANQSAKAATSAAENARQALVAANRPWIRVSVLGSGPIHFDSMGRLQVPVLFVLTNVGHSPAVDVQVDPGIYFYNSPQFVHPNEVLRNIVSKWKGLHRRSEIVLFPGDSIQLPYVMTSNPVSKMERIYPEMGRALAPVIVGTVAYYTRVDKDTHQTTFGFDVARRVQTAVDVAKRRSPDAIFADEGAVSADNVRLTTDPMVGSYAD